MRFFFIALLSLLCISCASTRKAALSAVEIEEIKPRYIEQQDFVRVAEYLSGKENTGNRMIFRSDVDARSGYYFTLILNKKIARLPTGTTITAEVYSPTLLDPQSYSFTLPAKRPKTKEISIGLTGADWPNVDTIPSAWRFTLRGPDGSKLGTRHSYLWKM
ncbi:MAG: hypothetical protein ACI81V_000247 [Lentimonas sp.]|jgi:hypothetical protein